MKGRIKEVCGDHIFTCSIYFNHVGKTLTYFSENLVFNIKVVQILLPVQEI